MAIIVEVLKVYQRSPNTNCLAHIKIIWMYPFEHP